MSSVIVYCCSTTNWVKRVSCKQNKNIKIISLGKYLQNVLPKDLSINLSPHFASICISRVEWETARAHKLDGHGLLSSLLATPQSLVLHATHCNANRRTDGGGFNGGDEWWVPAVRGQGHYNCALIIFNTQLSFLPGPRFPPSNI